MATADFTYVWTDFISFVFLSISYKLFKIPLCNHALSRCMFTLIFQILHREINGILDGEVAKGACCQVWWLNLVIPWWKEKMSSQIVLRPQHVHGGVHRCVYTYNNFFKEMVYNIVKSLIHVNLENYSWNLSFWSNNAWRKFKTLVDREHLRLWPSISQFGILPIVIFTCFSPCPSPLKMLPWARISYWTESSFQLGWMVVKLWVFLPLSPGLGLQAHAFLPGG